MGQAKQTTGLTSRDLLAGRYELGRELGRGAQGRVILALDHAAGMAERVLKLVPESEAERVRWEFTLLKALAHPNLARVFELLRFAEPVPKLSLARGTLALVCEVAAGSPADVLARARARDRDGLIALTWLVLDRVARALSAIHAQGFVHGDVKPANVIVADDTGGPADVKLIDLGLSRAPGAITGVSGTLGYLAPELFRGELSAAADIYALAMTGVRLLSPGSDPDPSLSPVEDLLRAFAAASSDPLPQFVPPALARLLGEMRAQDPALRPSAREVVRRIEDSVSDGSVPKPSARAESVAPPAEPGTTRTALERALFATQLPLAGQRDALAALLAALGSSGLVAVVGPPGSGRSRLVREAVGRLQVEAAAKGATVPTYRVHATLPVAIDPHRAIVHITAGDQALEERARALLRSAEVTGVSCTIVLEREHELPSADAGVHTTPLTMLEIESLLTHALPDAAVKAPLAREAAAVSGSLAGRLCRVLGAAFSSGDDPARAGVLRAHEGIAAAHASLPAGADELARLLAVAGGTLPWAAALACIPDADQLSRAAHLLAALGLCTRDEHGELELLPALVHELRASIAQGEQRALAQRVPAALVRGRARAFLAHAQGDLVSAEAALRSEIEAALRQGEPARAERLVGDALLLLGSLPIHLQLMAADALRAQGRYAAAQRVLEAVNDVAALAARAELSRLQGEAGQARSLAERVCEQAAERSPAARAATVLLARLALDAGDPASALSLAERVEPATDDDAALRAAEVAALAELSLGEPTRARARAEQALVVARARGLRAVEARLSSVLACVHRALLEPVAARREFTRAYDLADAAGEQHAAASFLVNLATSQLDAGELGPALEACRQGARRLAQLGRERDLARVLYNWAFARHLSGDDAGAEASLEHALQAAEHGGDASALAFALILRAELAGQAGDATRARATLEQIDELDRIDASERKGLLARAATVFASVAELAGSEEWLASARSGAAAEDGAAAVELALADTALCRARGQLGEAALAAEQALALARERGEYGIEVSALLAAAQAAEAAGDGALARGRYAELRSLLDAAALTLLPVDRMRLRAVPAYRAAFAALPKPAAAGSGNAERWRKLAALAKRLAVPHRPARLYEIVLDAAIDLSGAERAYLLWNDAEGVPRVRAARGLGERQLPADAVSRSIATRVIATGQPLSTVDASADARLSSAASVHALALRSVLAVPIRSALEIRGALYLDDRLRPFAFGEEDVALLSDLADLAALALESSELLRRERRAVRRLFVARERLARRVEAQAVELQSLRETGELAQSYPGIIVHSAAMHEAMRLSLRVARTDVPVLLRGESGTGKELVAKAIHAESMRKDRPFVTENCGAIPETLLESALFGHVKGAFTGADRRRQGLFEIADGGTLFLDEIGEMTPAMQARLLRVLQDGEIRPVGGERGSRVDVRVIAATHRDLEGMVKSGGFREDLYYRLAVVSVALPPLRERGDDIAPLVAHFIAKHAKGKKVRVERRALDRLRAERWPGNVRQLENEMRRALALCDDVIREDSFSFAPSAGAAMGSDAGTPAELDLRAQIDALERRLIRRALDDSKGNQTKASELLGVSRFGLQKMQKRLSRLA